MCRAEQSKDHEIMIIILSKIVLNRGQNLWLFRLEFALYAIRFFLYAQLSFINSNPKYFFFAESLIKVPLNTVFFLNIYKSWKAEKKGETKERNETKSLIPNSQTLDTD